MDTESIERELLQTLSCFINEIDLIFDYINKNSISKWKQYISDLHSDSSLLESFVSTTVQQLQPHERSISLVVLSKSKIRRTAYDFLSNVTLFSGDGNNDNDNDNNSIPVLDFSVFSDENKNTKLTIVKYLYNIYMTSYLCHFGIDNSSTKQFIDYLNDLKAKVSSRGGVNGTVKNKTNCVVETLNTANITASIMNNGNKSNNTGAPDVSNLGNLFESLMGNREIMNIAADLSKDIQNENLDPVSLLTSLMSGKPNDTIQRLVTNISGKIEDKIQRGEIDKDLLERQTQSILKNVSTDNIDNIDKVFTK